MNNPLRVRPAEVGWYLAHNDEAQGPFDLDTLVIELSRFALPQAVLVWCEGLPGWAAAKNVPALAERLLYPAFDQGLTKRLMNLPGGLQKKAGRGDPSPRATCSTHSSTAASRQRPPCGSRA